MASPWLPLLGAALDQFWYRGIARADNPFCVAICRSCSFLTLHNIAAVKCQQVAALQITPPVVCGRCCASKVCWLNCCYFSCCCPQMLGIGKGRFNATTANLNTVNPVYRDTASMPDNGWIAVRFLVGNMRYIAPSIPMFGYPFTANDCILISGPAPTNCLSDGAKQCFATIAGGQQGPLVDALPHLLVWHGSQHHISPLPHQSFLADTTSCMLHIRHHCSTCMCNMQNCSRAGTRSSAWWLSSPLNRIRCARFHCNPLIPEHVYPSPAYTSCFR